MSFGFLLETQLSDVPDQTAACCIKRHLSLAVCRHLTDAASSNELNVNEYTIYLYVYVYNKGGG